MEKKGKLIVLDGLDGCGKSTQFEAVQKSLAQQGKPVKAISFPMYEKPSAALVKMYLGGEFSDTPGGVNAYAASSFYAVDRYANWTGSRTTAGGSGFWPAGIPRPTPSTR